MDALAKISLESWLTMAAIVVGPVAALLIQKYLEEKRARENRKIEIFRNLMASRASRLSPTYVQALNGIETEFYGDTKVIEAWRSLVSYLYTNRGTDPNQTKAWDDRVTDLLFDLLYVMAESLGYHFDKVSLQRNVYLPGGWVEVEAEQHQLRKAAVAVFDGSKTLKVELQNPGPR
jgi:hypothetical protein